MNILEEHPKLKPKKKVSTSSKNAPIEYLVDKYIPSDINDLITPHDKYMKQLELKTPNSFNNKWISMPPNKCFFHKEIMERLVEISKDDELPHIIFYGNPGTGKKTLVNLFLEVVFDKSIYKLDDSKYSVTSSGNVETEVIVKQSDYHIIIEPNNNNHDRYLIQYIVKEYAKRFPLCIYEKSRSFKMVQINHLDNLSYYAQTSLRRTIEKYSKTCRFIMWCHSLSKVIEPLRSRCLCIHVPTQSDDQLITWAHHINLMSNIKIPWNLLDQIISSSGGDIKNILWKMDLYKHCGRIKNNYYQMLDAIINEIFGEQRVWILRSCVYDMMISNVSTNVIIKDILNVILSKVSMYPVRAIMEILDVTCKYEYRLSKGRRHIIHIETFLEKIIQILKK